ncbi:hypothetical protein D3C86_2017390 [compost metagenome]
MKLTCNYEVHIFCRMSTFIMLLDIGECNIRNRLKPLTVGVNILAKLLLNLWPENTVMVIEVACELTLHITLLGLKLFGIETRFTNSNLLER